MTTAMVLVAAGLGRRLGDDGPKALVEVAGRSLLAHALDRVRQVAAVTELVVVCPAGEEEAFEAIASAHAADRVVPGGERRTESVRAGVAALSDAPTIVAVHDAARAFTPAATIEAVIGVVERGAIAAAPAVAVADTLKRVEGDEVVATVPRQDLRAVQTPQSFRRDVLDLVLTRGSASHATDDLGLVERAREEGLVEGTIRLVPGSIWATKVTYPEDLLLAELLAQAEAP